ncbi:hypothetical protein FJZ19_06125 [Candidatus Pacearchaeota archaeon]|nr:hypothetical protein [Candidatus Pacearchaeota archaeon]
MALLDNVIEMHEQGMSDADIAQKLKEQGINAKEIDEAINQSKIKSAVEGQESAMSQQAGMQPSVITQEQGQEQVQQQYYQYPQEQQYEYYQPQQQGISADTVTEIAEQVISEKFLKVKKQLDSILELKSVSESKISSIDERLKRIEMIIEKLQISILEKVGGYGQAIGDIKNEMEMMQESFSKAVNPIIDKARKNQNIEEKPMKKQQPKKQEKQEDSDGFENYLR